MLFLSKLVSYNSSIFNYYKLVQSDKTEPAISMKVNMACEEHFLITSSSNLESI